MSSMQNMHVLRCVFYSLPFVFLEDTYRKIFVFNDMPESVDILDTATNVSTKNVRGNVRLAKESVINWIINIIIYKVNFQNGFTLDIEWLPHPTVCIVVCRMDVIELKKFKQIQRIKLFILAFLSGIFQ